MQLMVTLMAIGVTYNILGHECYLIQVLQKADLFELFPVIK